MHVIETDGGRVVFYVRRQTHEGKEKFAWPKTWTEVAVYKDGGPAAAVALSPKEAFQLICVCEAYRETMRQEMGYDVDAERRASEARMSFRDALWLAWHTIIWRRSVGSLALEAQALQHDLTRLRGEIAAAQTKPEGTT